MKHADLLRFAPCFCGTLLQKKSFNLFSSTAARYLYYIWCMCCAFCIELDVLHVFCEHFMSCVYVCIYINMYKFVHKNIFTYLYKYTHVFLYICKERRERERYSDVDVYIL